MKENTRRNIFTAVLIIFFLITGYFTILPFFRPTQAHLDLELPRHVFYTVQSNIIVMGWCLYLVLRRFIKRLPVIHQGVTLAMVIYITVTGIVYWTILVPMLNAVPVLFKASNIWLHTVTPVFGIWCFLNYSRKEPVKKLHTVLAMIYPSLYFLYAFYVHDKYGKFPYPFLDMNSMGGLAGVIAVCLLILCLFFVMGWVFQKAYDRRLYAHDKLSD